MGRTRDQSTEGCCLSVFPILRKDLELQEEGKERGHVHVVRHGGVMQAKPELFATDNYRDGGRFLFKMRLWGACFSRARVQV